MRLMATHASWAGSYGPWISSESQVSMPLTVFLPIPDDVLGLVRAGLRAEPPAWLPEAVAGEAGQWRARLRLDGFDGIDCRVGPVRQEATSLWRDLAWQAAQDARNGCHTFEGELGIHAAGSVLVLTGDCTAANGSPTDLHETAALANRLGTALLLHIASRTRLASLGVTVDAT